MNPDQSQDPNDMSGMPPVNDQGGGIPTTPPEPTGDQGMPQTGNDQGMGQPPVGDQGFGGNTAPTGEPTVPGAEQPEEGGESQQPPAPGM